MLLYHAHEWEWEDGEEGYDNPFAHYDNDAVYFTDSLQYASEFGKYIDVCEVNMNNPYIILEDDEGIKKEDGSYWKDEYGNILGIGDVCDYDCLIEYLIGKGYDGVMSQNSKYIVVSLRSDNVKILHPLRFIFQ